MIAGHDDRLGLRGIEGADLALVAVQPGRILVAQTDVHRQPVVHADVILDEVLVVPVAGRRSWRRIGTRHGGRIPEQEVGEGIAARDAVLSSASRSR